MADTSASTALPDPNRPGGARPRDAGATRFTRSNRTRVIHLVLLLVVLHQLVTSKVMQGPGHGHTPTVTYFTHEYVGMIGLLTVATFWLWAVLRRGETRLSRLLPWFSGRGVRDVALDIAHQARRLARLKAPDDEDGALASAVHGLGLLLVTAMATTGTFAFFDGGTMAAHYAFVVHRTLSNLVWIYLFAHAGLAVLHWLLGSDIFTRMFWVRGRRARA